MSETQVKETQESVMSNGDMTAEERERKLKELDMLKELFNTPPPSNVSNEQMEKMMDYGWKMLQRIAVPDKCMEMTAKEKREQQNMEKLDEVQSLIYHSKEEEVVVNVTRWNKTRYDWVEKTLKEKGYEVTYSSNGFGDVSMEINW